MSQLSKAIEQLRPTIGATVGQAVKAAVNESGNTVVSVNTVAEKVTKEVAAVVINQTNQEPWYRSRITLAQYVTLVATLLGLLGYTIQPELREQIIVAILAIGALVNPAYTLWARWFPAKPLGQ